MIRSDPPAQRAEAPAAPRPETIPPLRKSAIVVVGLEQDLASKLLAELDRDAVEAVTLEIARLDRIDPAEQRVVLGEFFDLGLRRLWFTFDDLTRLDDDDLRLAYEPERASTWALALAGAARSVRDRVLEVLPPPQAETLNATLEQIGPFRLDDAEGAQAELVDHVRELHDRGRITLPAPAGREAILV